MYWASGKNDHRTPLRKGYSQQKLAALVGISIVQYQRLEYGEQDKKHGYVDVYTGDIRIGKLPGQPDTYGSDGGVNRQKNLWQLNNTV